MSDRKADAPLSVEIPSRDDDRPAWGKVGAITAVGFVVGVAWPHVAGVRVGPSLPADALLPATSASAAGSAGEGSGASPSLELAARATPGPASAPAPAPAAAPAVARASVSVGHGAIFSCRTSSDELLKGADCGTVAGLDGVVTPALRKLVDCPAAATANGKLHLTVRVDFSKGSIGAEAGKNSTVADADGLVACAKTALADVRPTSVAHENQRYGVSYHLTFGAAGGDDRSGGAASASASSAGSPSAGAASGSAAGAGSASDAEAQVAWDVAIVRDAPRTGKIVAKLDRGTSVRVGAVAQGWYPVKYGEGFANEGWVYRGALGR
jgi:hypothetical protein